MSVGPADLCPKLGPTNPKTIFQGIISWFITNNFNNTNMGGTNETTAGSDTWLQFIQMCTWHLSTQWASRILERDDCITFRIIRNCHFLFNLWKFKIKIYNARIVIFNDQLYKGQRVSKRCTIPIDWWISIGNFISFWDALDFTLPGRNDSPLRCGMIRRVNQKWKPWKDSKYLELSNYERLLTLFMISMCSKATATSLCYPHEVIRTRLREETSQSRYR